MNAPDRFESFTLPASLSKLVIQPSTVTPSTCIITVNREDHTLGNLLCSYLQKHPNVLFAGYKVPHPLEHHFELRVQTSKEHDPLTVVQRVLDGLLKDLSILEDQVRFELKKYSK